jgi:hypothetical protein
LRTDADQRGAKQKSGHETAPEWDLDTHISVLSDDTWRAMASVMALALTPESVDSVL